MSKEELMRLFNEGLSFIINKQKDMKQPIYLIASYWCGIFNGIEDIKNKYPSFVTEHPSIEDIFSTDGDNNLEEMKEYFDKHYAWHKDEIGVTEQTYALIKVDIAKILNHRGDEVLENDR